MIHEGFVCKSLVDETKFESREVDGYPFCSERGIEDYCLLSDVEYEELKKEYQLFQ